MAITSRDTYFSAAKQSCVWDKTTARTTIAAGFFSLFDVAGNPGGGTLAIGNTANGLVHTDATAGYPAINTFGGGNTGYLARLDFGNTVSCRISLFDRLFVCGAYAFNANTALSTQPSFSSRIPGGTDYTNLQLWVEQVTAATGNEAVNVTYTNSDGTASRTTGAVGIGAAPTLGRCWQLPLQAGDKGVQLITNVAGSVATVGTFNVMILRPLWTGRVMIANGGDIHGINTVGLPVIYDTSALYALVAADSTSSGLPRLLIEAVNG